MARVVITRDKGIENAIDSAFDQIDKLDDLIRGKQVAIKPNDTWASAKDKTAITQPDTLRAVIRNVKKYDPSTLVVSGGSGAGETEKIFRVGGLMKVIEEEKVSFFDHNHFPFVEVQ